MKHLTQEEMEALNVGDVVEILIPRGWTPAVVVPSVYYGVVMFYTLLRTSGSKKKRRTLEGRLDDDCDYNNHRYHIGRCRPDCVRRLQKDRKFPWSWRAKD